ncbi:hypothetical protein GCM10010203_47230 [Actinomadura yumaensis]
MVTMTMDVRELNAAEIEEVTGGAIWVPIAAAAARCAASGACRTAVRAGVLGAAGAVAAVVGYENNRE